MTSTPPTPPPLPSRFAQRAGRSLAKLLGWFLLAATTGWSALAIFYASLNAGPPRWFLATLFVVAAATILFLVRPRRYRYGAHAVLCASVLTWFLCLSPSNDRAWNPEMARLASADIEGSHVTVHNVRNFHYRTSTDFDQVWEDRSYDLDRLSSVDLILSHWGSKAVAHSLISFGFDDGQYLAISIEARRKGGEPYSVVPALFKEYELIYTAADERDVLRLRTNIRHEDVYLYRIRGTQEAAKAGLLSYLKRINDLRDRPEWYNLLTTNCANSILPHARDAGNNGSLTWEIVLSGYAARPAYRNGRLDTSMPFEELERRSHINAAAIAADDAPDFSAKVRAGLPVPHR